MEIEIGRLMRAVRRYWWLPVICALVFGVVGIGSTRVGTENYTATSRMLILPEGLQGVSVTNGSANMLIDIATSNPVLDQVVRDLELGMTSQELEGATVVVLREGTSLLLISVTNEDPQMAADISNAITSATETRSTDLTLVELQQRQSDQEFRANELNDQLSTIDARIEILDAEAGENSEREAELAGLQQDRLIVAQEKSDVDASLRGSRKQISLLSPVVSIVEPAHVPEQKDGLSPVISGIIGGFVGAIVGAALILWRAAVDHTVINAAHLARITGAPTLRELAPGEAANHSGFVTRLVSELSKGHEGVKRQMTIVAPTKLPDLENQIIGSDNLAGDALCIANGTSGDDEQYAMALQSGGAIIAAQVGKTTESDVRTTVDSLRIVGVPVVGNIVLKER